ncbi:DUF4190 domain-containing protein [Streptomyces sp. I05A-00742]|uniref:DUF4190 domain-containing protein n=1 Tax=Streptomyces sp. I05A-00742 TaxID=2732853 RepID=UPI001488B285|nr:DUF4190 domain-containing protein [Streptomyces sp. I05A-00742]
MSGYGQNSYGQPQQPQQPPQQPGYGYPGPGSQPQGGYPVAPPVQPYGAGPYAPPMQMSNGMGTAGLVTGIIGAVCSLIVVFWLFGLILGILGIVFGAVGRSKVSKGLANNRGSATAGIVLGVVALALPFLWFALFASAVSSAAW